MLYAAPKSGSMPELEGTNKIVWFVIKQALETEPKVHALADTPYGNALTAYKGRIDVFLKSLQKTNSTIYECPTAQTARAHHTSKLKTPAAQLKSRELDKLIKSLETEIPPLEEADAAVTTAEGDALFDKGLDSAIYAGLLLLKVAEAYEEEVNNAVDALSSLLEPMIIVIIGVMVGAMVVAMYLPIFKMAAVL